MNKFQSTTLKKELTIDKIFTIHYFEYQSDFYFEGETHNFWEFLYVDKGEVCVTADTTQFFLKRGDIIFHKPNEFHNLRAYGNTAPNLVVVSFSSASPTMQFFNNKLLKCGETERALLAKIIKEASTVFSSRLDDPYLTKLEKVSKPPFASEQLIHLYLEEFLLLLQRAQRIGNLSASVVKPTHLRKSDYIYECTLEYLESHLCSLLTVDEICNATLIGRSQLQKIFRAKNSCGVMEYFSKMKIEAAKEMIRENRLNFTQIADYLGYTSIHYFSRQFKKITGMTPSEYSSSIKSLVEKSESIKK